MSDMGIAGAVRNAMAQQLSTAGQLTLAPQLAQVTLPAAPQADGANRPRRTAAAFDQPRDMDGGRSPLATGPVATTFAGVGAVGPRSQSLEEAAREVARDAARNSHAILPQAAGLVAYTDTPWGRVYLEQQRFEQHIMPAHVIDPPQLRSR